MPRIKPRAQKPHQIPMDFASLITQMHQDLKAEGQGRDQAFDREMAKQFRRATDEMANKLRGRSLFYFSWRVFEGVSNHFWPGSVMPEDRPSVIRETSRPFICPTTFRVVDTHAMSFRQLVDFIQCGGQGPFRWPKRSKVQRIVERNAKKVRHLKTKPNRPGDDGSNPIVISPARNTSPRPPVTFGIPKKTNPSTLLRPPLPGFSTPNKTHSSSLLPPSKINDTPNIPEPSPRRAQLAPTRIDPRARTLWDEDIEIVEAPPQAKIYMTSRTRHQIPRLSVVCQPGWDLNNKTVWIPTTEIQDKNHVVPSQTINTQPLHPVEPSLGTVSFSKVPEKEIEAFLLSFLGNGEV